MTLPASPRPDKEEKGMVRTFRYRLAPTPAQAAHLGRVAGACRFVYNLALEQRRDWFRQYRANTGRAISYIAQSYELTALRAEVAWLADMPRDALDNAVRQLDRAYAAFFAGRARYPTFRRRDDGCGFTVRAKWSRVARLNAKRAMVHLPKVGWVIFRLTRELPDTCKLISVREDGGHWFISFMCEVPTAATSTSAQIGIDRGIANTLALSTGEMLSVPASLLAVEAARRRAQRTLCRRKKGSNRRAKQRARVARLHARARRIRKDWAHRVSTDIATRFGTVAVEDLKIPNMVRANRGLSRSIHNQGWGQVVSFLAYKLEASGGTLIKVNPAYTSQTCSACGVVDSQSRESQARFLCVHCGHDEHADTNAAKNILSRSTACKLVEGSRQRPDEARTIRKAA